MKRVLAGLAAITMTLTFNGFCVPAAHAQGTDTSRTYEYIVYNDTIHVNGKVLPARHAVVNMEGEIIEIASNTYEDAEPKFYLNHVSKESEVRVSERFYEEFKTLVPDGTSKPGILYAKQNGPQNENGTQKRSAMMRIISVLPKPFS